ncbi:MAG: hypothetical protein M3R17_04455 [Bacteroidota bacterium]|nr:hypothetical protein [Bacteroidota bacterium]
MKKIIFPIAVLLFSGAAILNGCRSSAEKVEDAEENVEQAQIKLIQARADSADDANTKTMWEARIAKNEVTLADYRVKVTTLKKEEERKANEERLKELEMRNERMKAQMIAQDREDRTKWEVFKADFNNSVDEFDSDMDAFGKAFENLGRK